MEVLVMVTVWGLAMWMAEAKPMAKVTIVRADEWETN